MRGWSVGWFGLKVEYLEDLMERLVLFGCESVGYAEKTLQNTKGAGCFFLLLKWGDKNEYDMSSEFSVTSGLHVVSGGIILFSKNLN